MGGEPSWDLRTQIRSVLKLQHRMHMLSFGRINISLTTVIIQRRVFFYYSTNKKVIGKFKDEAAGIPIKEFIGLKSKMYSYIKDNAKNVKTCKGVKKDVIKKNITHENYIDTLMNGKQMTLKINTMRSDHHQLGSYELNKISLSCFDDKRHILEDGISSYAYGHKNI